MRNFSIDTILEKISEGEWTLEDAKAEIRKTITSSKGELCEEDFFDGQEGHLLTLTLEGETDAEMALYQLSVYRECVEEANELYEDDGFNLADEWED